MWISSNRKAACRLIYRRMAMTDVTREITPAVFKGALPGRPAKRNNTIKNYNIFHKKKNLSHFNCNTFYTLDPPPQKKKKRKFVKCKEWLR